MNPYDEDHDPEFTARLLAQDLAAVGEVSCVARFDGWALLDGTVMFGFVNERSDLFLRASELTAARFAELGSTKHPDMPYWSVPVAAKDDLATLRHWAYEAADIAHLAHGSVGQHVDQTTETADRPTPLLHMPPTRRPQDKHRR